MSTATTGKDSDLDDLEVLVDRATEMLDNRVGSVGSPGNKIVRRLPRFIAELRAARRVVEAVKEGYDCDAWCCSTCDGTPANHEPDCPLAAYLALRPGQE